MCVYALPFLIIEELNNIYNQNNFQFDLLKLKELHNFIFNNNFQNPHLNRPDKIIRFSEVLDNLKILILNSIHFLESLDEKKPIPKTDFIPVIIDYLHNETDDKDEEFTVKNLENIFKKYIDKVKIDVNLQNLDKPLHYNYTDLNLDTLFFLEITQNYIDNMKIGTCSNCNDFFILSNRQDRWVNAYCSNDCRIKHRNYSSNKNKKEKLLKDKKYRANTNEYMRNYMREYRRLKNK